MEKHFNMDLQSEEFFKQVCEFADLPVDDIVAEVIDNERFRHYLAETCASAYHKDFAWFGGHKDVDACYRCEDFESWTYEDCDNFANKVADGSIRYWAPIILKTLKARMSMPSEVKARKDEARIAEEVQKAAEHKRLREMQAEFKRIIPEEYRTATVQDFPAIKDLIVGPIIEKGMSAILYGGNGVGKTRLAWALMREFRKEGISSSYDNLAAFLAQLSSLAMIQKRSAIDVIECGMVKQIGVMIFDECDKTEIEGNAFRNFSYLINRRYEEGKQTLIFCNALNDDELRHKLGDSIVSRFHSESWGAKVFFLGNNDKRPKKPPTQGDLL